MGDSARFRVSVADEKLALLRQKLAVTTLPDELVDAQWSLGAPLSDIKRLAAYWQNGFDWRAQEAKLNELPQYHTFVDVDGFGDIGIHYVYQQSGTKGAIPLLFSHGCESSRLGS